MINPVDSRLASLEKADTLERRYEQPADVRVFDHFRSLAEEELRSLYESLNLAMTFRDFQFIQTYYLQEAHRDPTVTEIRVLDTYWSDHCRHTTFATELRTISIEDGQYKKPIEETLRQYLSDRRTVYGDRKGKYVCLMDLATMGARILKKEGRLTDQEDTDERDRTFRRCGNLSGRRDPRSAVRQNLCLSGDAYHRCGRSPSADR